MIKVADDPRKPDAEQTVPPLQPLPPSAVRANPRGHRLLSFVGGTLFMLVVMLFLAAIQPVGKDKDKISVARSIKINIAQRDRSLVKPPPKPQKERPPERKKEPPKKRERRPSPKKTIEAVRKPTRSAPPRPSAPAGLNVSVFSGLGTGGGGALQLAVSAEEQAVEYDDAEMKLFEQAREVAAREENRIADAQRRERPSGQSREPGLVFNPDPEYPKSAESDGLEGWVRVSVFVTEDGTSTKPRIEVSSSPIFEQAALDAAVLATWESARDERGRPIGKFAEIEYVFKLERR